MKEIQILVSSFVSFIVLDFFWLKFIAGNFYKTKLGSLITLNPDNSIQFEPVSGILVYVFMATLVTFFLLPKVQNMHYFQTAVWAGSFGIMVFSIYDLTNYSTLKNWSLSFSIVDMLWGGFAFLTTTLIIKYFFK